MKVSHRVLRNKYLKHHKKDPYDNISFKEKEIA